VPNRQIELHDTRIDRIEHIGGSIVLSMLAYMHESDGRPGWDRGTGWELPARLVIEDGRFDRPLSGASLEISDGLIIVDERRFENLIPLPFDEHGYVRVFLAGAEGRLTITGHRAYIEPTGQAVYLEDFSGTKNT
jgi:hypothetical protein